MTRRNATSLPGGLLGRHKRKRGPEISDMEECSPFLSSLHKAISKEVETLEHLTSAIEEADTDEDQPIHEHPLKGLDKEESQDVPSGTAHEKVAPCNMWQLPCLSISRSIKL